MATPEQPLVTQADIDAWKAQYQKSQADQAAALTAAQKTGLSDWYTPLYGGADIVPGMTQGILSNLGINNPYMPVYSLLGSENSGAATDATERMQFAPTPGVSYRLVDKNTGQVTTASTPEEIKALTQQANALSKSGGNKANLAIESNQTGNWSPIYTDEPNILMDTEMKLIAAAMLAATGAGALQPGGFAGAGAGAAGTGAGAAGTTAATSSGLIPGALSGANALSFAPIASAAIPAGASAASDLVITALMAKGLTLAEATALAATGGAAAALSSTAGSASTPASASTSSNAPAGSDASELVVTGHQPTNLLVGDLATPAAAAAAAAANAAGATTSASDLASSRVTPTAAETAALNAGAGAGGLLGTGITASQALTGASLISSLLGGAGGSGSSGTGTPYVSPFGAGPSIGGQDFRVKPNITNYEQYGFGPEATFFSPEYNKLVSGGAGTGYTAASGGVTAYNPLIGGTNTTGNATTTTASNTDTTTPPANFVDTRPAGWTGTLANQKVGDTQVVDGTTWVYGGPDAGWQMQYKNASGGLSLLPGNGATNVSSLANQPVTKVNEPYFAQNTANIPGWATTYHGFQQGLMGAGVSADQRAKAEQELFGAIQTQPFANPQALVDYARTVYNKYTAPTPAATSTNTGGILGALTNAGTSTQSPLNMTQEQKANFINAFSPGYDPNKPMVSNGPYTGGYTPSAPGSNPDAMKLSNFNPMSALTGMSLLGSLQQDFNNATYVPRTDGTVPTALTQEQLWGIVS